ncbi:DNA cytosine methyltransferase [Porphyromonas sp. HMSC065F10]|uniref:DNA cytosine methyltransferase n=1 Tax=Porphyromonas sp. HMSC065F10 TaxID=1739394 RepID=UPI0008A4E4A0|nr:DNA cytosine methyltransferase [Porphyromonas sp. HMSC065F10]OFR36622.1 DNA cytosine methyltransferase [Porphyromonas sp. HMSC065F10]
MAKNNYRLIDLFAGCGGMSLGFQNAGFEVIAAYDFWQAAIDIYKENFQHPIYKVDLSQKDISEELAAANPDIITGGPPCQDFSIAGKREFEGKRANLTLIYSNIISAVKPRWFVMENVYNIEKSPVFAQAVSNFRKAGYGITKRIWDASYMGVPQMRKRYFVIGKLGAPDDFLMPSLLKGLTEKRMTVRQYLKDSPLDTEYYYMHPRSYARRAIFSIDEPSVTIRGVNRPIPSGYQFHPADKTRDINLVRSLTSKERSYLQTFPAEFIFVGAKTDIEQAIGNAVPVKMAEYIAKRIIRYMMDYD